jgi:hypothetical protein
MAENGAISDYTGRSVATIYNISAGDVLYAKSTNGQTPLQIIR